MPNLRRRKQPQIRPVVAKSSLGFDYQIRFSQRKSAAIEIKQESVTVAAPFGADPRELHQWVVHKKHWILSKLENQQLKRLETPAPQFVDGEIWPFMGRNLTLHLIYQSRRETEIQGSELRLAINQSQLKCTPQTVQRKLADWYKSQAQEYMGPKSLRYARQLGENVTDITFRRTKTKWGHCTNRGVLQYNWLIMMAPTPIIDYLIAHEVSHLRHLNHSVDFWKTVAVLTPNYLKERHWLKENGHKMQF